MKNTQNNYDWLKVIILTILMAIVIFGPRNKGSWVNCAQAQAQTPKKGENKKPEAPVEVFTFSADDEYLAKNLKELYFEGSTPAGFCSLVTVVANEESWSRDLAVAYVGDLGGGASVLRRSHANEAGVVSFLVANNTKIELLEDNSFLGMSFYSRKASGETLEKFVENAAQAGYKVTVSMGNNFSCTSKVRQENLEKEVLRHQKQLKEKEENKKEVVKKT